MPMDIVELAVRIKSRSRDRSKPSWPPSDPERFLADEGLDLLASYRSIIDGTVRALVAEFVDAVAKLQLAKGQGKSVIGLVKPDETSD